MPSDLTKRHAEALVYIELKRCSSQSLVLLPLAKGSQIHKPRQLLLRSPLPSKCNLRDLHVLPDLPKGRCIISAIQPCAPRVSKMSSRLTEPQIKQLDGALSFISSTLANRLRPLLLSQSRPDLYESITAAIYLMSSASSPQFVSRESRLRSFANSGWPVRAQEADEMVESGFFHTGEADHVKCFFCDLGLRDWAPGDLPATEHVKFSPLCFFLKSSRGLDWLKSASIRPPNYPASYLRQDHNELARLLHEELQSKSARVACGLGFSDTLVLLCVSRKFIRFRQKFELQALVTELQSEWEKLMLMEPGREPQFEDRFDLASVLRAFSP